VEVGVGADVAVGGEIGVDVGSASATIAETVASKSGVEVAMRTIGVGAGVDVTSITLIEP
jgi:hypothetical protein